MKNMSPYSIVSLVLYISSDEHARTSRWRLLVGLTTIAAASGQAADLRLGMIGLDTPHAVNFTQIFNDSSFKSHVPGAKVVGGYKAHSPDVEGSAANAEKFSSELQQKYGVKLYDSVEELARNVDGLLIESIDGRAHPVQVRAAILAGKPIYVDKPMAISVKAAVEMFRMAREHGVPIFSSSAARFQNASRTVRLGSIGKVSHVEAESRIYLEPHHPDLFWYGIHAVEVLFTVMGPGVETVSRINSAPGKIQVEGRWAGSRTGIVREGSWYTGKAVGEKGEAVVGTYDGYHLLLEEIVVFMRSGISPVPEQETIEVLAFMEADALSQKAGGKPVSIETIIKDSGWAPR
jgi:predicted dehydrogenase